MYSTYLWFNLLISSMYLRCNWISKYVAITRTRRRKSEAYKYLPGTLHCGTYDTYSMYKLKYGRRGTCLLAYDMYIQYSKQNLGTVSSRRYW